MAASCAVGSARGVNQASRLYAHLHPQPGAPRPVLCPGRFEHATFVLDALEHRPSDACADVNVSRPIRKLRTSARGLVNQLYEATNALREACAAGHHLFVEVFVDMRTHRRVPIDEVVDVGITSRALAANAHRQARLCPGTDVSMDCSRTRLVSAACLSDPRAHIVSAGRKHMFPRQTALLAMLELRSPRVPWQPTHCNFNKGAKYNAIHFNFDVDWLLFLCHSQRTYLKWYEHRMPYAEEHSLVGDTNSRAHKFARRRVLPVVLKSMRTAFRNPALPLLVCTSIGKLTNSTTWLIGALEDAVYAEYGMNITLSSSAVTERELAAASELRLLGGAEDVLLFPGSTFSAFAGMRVYMRGGKVSYIPDLRSSCKRGSASRSSMHSVMARAMKLRGNHSASSSNALGRSAHGGGEACSADFI